MAFTACLCVFLSFLLAVLVLVLGRGTRGGVLPCLQASTASMRSDLVRREYGMPAFLRKALSWSVCERVGTMCVREDVCVCVCHASYRDEAVALVRHRVALISLVMEYARAQSRIVQLLTSQCWERGGGGGLRATPSTMRDRSHGWALLPLIQTRAQISQPSLPPSP